MTEFKQQEITIEGMHCDACVRRVSHALGEVPGVRVESVGIGYAQMLAQPDCEQRIREAIENLGFTVKEVHGQG